MGSRLQVSTNGCYLRNENLIDFSTPYCRSKYKIGRSESSDELENEATILIIKNQYSAT